MIEISVRDGWGTLVPFSGELIGKNDIDVLELQAVEELLGGAAVVVLVVRVRGVHQLHLNESTLAFSKSIRFLAVSTF